MYGGEGKGESRNRRNSIEYADLIMIIIIILRGHAINRSLMSVPLELAHHRIL